MSNTHTNCIISLKLKKTSECEISKSFDFGTALGTIYPLLKIVFETLPYEDLKSAALVDDTWNRYACEELLKRNGASWICSIKTRNGKIAIKTSKNFKYDSVAFGLIFYEHSEIKLNEYVCVHGDPIARMTFAEYLATEVFPPDIDYWALSCSLIYSPKLDKRLAFSFTGLFIPEIPNIKIRKFCGALPEIDKSFTESILINEHIHCILLFTLSYCIRNVNSFMKRPLSQQCANSFALGGGVILGSVKPFEQSDKKRVFRSNALFCIAITQEKDKSADFDSYSIVIMQDDNFEIKLLEFKKVIEMREQSFAIRICCSAKEDKEMETASFIKIFPKTFVIGFDADGEIGWNKFASFQSENNVSGNKKLKLKPDISHQYTTIIVIMTWGKKIKQEQ